MRLLAVRLIAVLAIGSSAIAGAGAPAVADYSGGTLGFRVRVGRYSDPTEADATLGAVRAAGFTASRVFTGWDGAATGWRPSDQHPVGCHRRAPGRRRHPGAARPLSP
jgi:hypothetical protein